MKLIDRADIIIEELFKRDVLSVQDATELFDASPATVRRCFAKLAADNIVQRVRGGIRKANTNQMPPFALREIRYAAEKRRIMAEAASLLGAGDVVIVDGGTTTFMLSFCLPDIPLCLITNSMPLAAALDALGPRRSTLELHLTGGMLYPRSGFLVGPTAEAALARVHSQWAFLSAAGVTETGIYNMPESVVESEQTIIENSARVMIAADHSKIGRSSMCEVCGLDRVDILITDAWSDSEPMLESISASGVRVIVVPTKDPSGQDSK